MSTEILSAPDTLRYPIGRFMPSDFNESVRKTSIASLEALPENLRSAVSDLSDIQLNTPYREGGWTLRQVVHHVADSHINAYVRTRLALTEDWPEVRGYDEKLWAELPDARLLPVEVSLELLEPLHRRWVALFETLTPTDFERGYRHSENGPQTLAHVLPLYAWHCRHHVAQINALRDRKHW